MSGSEYTSEAISAFLEWLLEALRASNPTAAQYLELMIEIDVSGPTVIDYMGLELGIVATTAYLVVVIAIFALSNEADKRRYT